MGSGNSGRLAVFLVGENRDGEVFAWNKHHVCVCALLAAVVRDVLLAIDG